MLTRLFHSNKKLINKWVGAPQKCPMPNEGIQIFTIGSSPSPSDLSVNYVNAFHQWIKQKYHVCNAVLLQEHHRSQGAFGNTKYVLTPHNQYKVLNSIFIIYIFYCQLHSPLLAFTRTCHDHTSNRIGQNLTTCLQTNLIWVFFFFF